MKQISSLKESDAKTPNQSDHRLWYMSNLRIKMTINSFQIIKHLISSYNVILNDPIGEKNIIDRVNASIVWCVMIMNTSKSNKYNFFLLFMLVIIIIIICCYYYWKTANDPSWIRASYRSTFFTRYRNTHLYIQFKIILHTGSYIIFYKFTNFLELTFSLLLGSLFKKCMIELQQTLRILHMGSNCLFVLLILLSNINFYRGDWILTSKREASV